MEWWDGSKEGDEFATPAPLSGFMRGLRLGVKKANLAFCTI